MYQKKNFSNFNFIILKHFDVKEKTNTKTIKSNNLMLTKIRIPRYGSHFT